MSKRYYFDNTDIFSIIDEFYPISDNNSFDHKNFTNDNLDNFINRIEDVLEDIRVEDINEENKNLDDKDFLSEQVNEKIKDLFSNPDLLIFGNGGMADKIMSSGHFYCRFPNLDSHFIPLTWNDDLNKLNHWSHNDASKISFLVLNKRENNPIFKDIDSNNPDSYFRYEIPIEYFAGYYDRDKQIFVENDKFKLEHDYDETCTIYHNPVPSILLNGEPENIEKFYETMREFAYTVLNTSDGLSEKGYEGICNQFRTMIANLRRIQCEFTPEFFSQIQNEAIDDTLKLLDELDATEEVVQEDSYVDSGWEDDWEPEEDTPPKL